MQMEDKIKDAFREAMDNDDLEIELTDTFRDYEDWDSLAYLSMIAALDEEFGVEIENEEFEQLETVQDLLEAVKGKAGN
jgi:acyl carrier protein